MGKSNNCIPINSSLVQNVFEFYKKNNSSLTANIVAVKLNVFLNNSTEDISVNSIANGTWKSDSKLKSLLDRLFDTKVNTMPSMSIRINNSTVTVSTKIVSTKSIDILGSYDSSKQSILIPDFDEMEYDEIVDLIFDSNNVNFDEYGLTKSDFKEAFCNKFLVQNFIQLYNIIKCKYENMRDVKAAVAAYIQSISLDERRDINNSEDNKSVANGTFIKLSIPNDDGSTTEKKVFVIKKGSSTKYFNSFGIEVYYNEEKNGKMRYNEKKRLLDNIIAVKEGKKSLKTIKDKEGKEYSIIVSKNSDGRYFYYNIIEGKYESNVKSRFDTSELDKVQNEYEKEVTGFDANISSKPKHFDLHISKDRSSYLTRDYVKGKAKEKEYFVFGDNVADQASGYIPSSTQAVIRGLDNAIGINTKKNRGTENESYYTDNDYESWVSDQLIPFLEKCKEIINKGGKIIFPADEDGNITIGLGKAELDKRAPKIYEELVKAFEEIKNYDPSSEKNSLIEIESKNNIEETIKENTKQADISVLLYVPGGESKRGDGVDVAFTSKSFRSALNFIETNNSYKTTKEKLIKSSIDIDSIDETANEIYEQIINKCKELGIDPSSDSGISINIFGNTLHDIVMSLNRNSEDEIQFSQDDIDNIFESIFNKLKEKDINISTIYSNGDSGFSLSAVKIAKKNNIKSHVTKTKMGHYTSNNGNIVKSFNFARRFEEKKESDGNNFYTKQTVDREEARKNTGTFYVYPENENLTDPNDKYDTNIIKEDEENVKDAFKGKRFQSKGPASVRGLNNSGFITLPSSSEVEEKKDGDIVEFYKKKWFGENGNDGEIKEMIDSIKSGGYKNVHIPLMFYKINAEKNPGLFKLVCEAYHEIFDKLKENGIDPKNINSNIDSIEVNGKKKLSIKIVDNLGKVEYVNLEDTVSKNAGIINDKYKSINKFIQKVALKSKDIKLNRTTKNNFGTNKAKIEFNNVTVEGENNIKIINKVFGGNKYGYRVSMSAMYANMIFSGRMKIFNKEFIESINNRLNILEAQDNDAIERLNKLDKTSEEYKSLSKEVARENKVRSNERKKLNIILGRFNDGDYYNALKNGLKYYTHTPIMGKNKGKTYTGIDAFVEVLRSSFYNESKSSKCSEYQKNEYLKLADNMDILLEDILEELSIISGIKINLNKRDNDDTERELDKTIQDDENGDDYTENSLSKNGWDFKIRFIDQIANASKEVKAVMSKVPKKNRAGEIVRDDLGRMVFVSGNAIHYTLINELSNIITDADDFYCPFKLNEDGNVMRDDKGVRIQNTTPEEVFPALTKLETKLPWVNDIKMQLWKAITIEDKDTKVRSFDAENRVNESLVSKFFVDLNKDFIPFVRSYVKDGKILTASMNMRSSKYSAIEEMKLNSQLGTNLSKVGSGALLEYEKNAIDRAKARGYKVSYPTSNEGMLCIYNEIGMVNMSGLVATKGLLDFIREDYTSKNGESIIKTNLGKKNYDDAFGSHLEAFTEILRRIGYDISEEDTASILKDLYIDSTTNHSTDRIMEMINSIDKIIKHNIKKGKSGAEIPFFIDRNNSKGDFEKVADIIGVCKDLDTQVTTRYDGKTRQSYSAPNVISKYTKMFKSPLFRKKLFDEKFNGIDYFIKNGSEEYRNIILEIFNPTIKDDECSEYISNARRLFQYNEIFKHNDKDFNDWDKNDCDSELLIQYLRYQGNATENTYADYGFPALADSPALVTWRLPRFVGNNYKHELLKRYAKVVRQEYDRINLCRQRKNAVENLYGIQYFDDNGTKFCMFPELNNTKVSVKKILDIIEKPVKENVLLGNSDTESKYTDNSNITEESIDLKTILDAINGVYDKNNEDAVRIAERYNENNSLNVIECVIELFVNNALNTMTKSYIDGLDIDTMTETIKMIGVGIGDNDANSVKKLLEEFYWNSTYMGSQITQVMVGDMAFQKNGTDFQKRFKEVYASGNRLNTNSKYGRKIQKTVYIRDVYRNSSTYGGIKKVLRNAVEEGRLRQEEADAILEKYEKINIADGQAYRSLWSYRAVLDMQGRLDEEAEAALNAIENGNWSFGDFNIVMNALKPFIYTNIKVDSQVKDADGNPIMLSSPNQNKNSEFVVLALFNAIAQGDSQSNFYKGVGKFFDKNRYCDVIDFESAVKNGGQGVTDLGSNSELVEKVRKDFINKHFDGNKESFTKKAKNVLGEKSFNKMNDYDRLEAVMFDLAKNDKYTEFTFDDYNNLIEQMEPNEDDIVNMLTEACRSEEGELDFENGKYNKFTVKEIPYSDWMEAQPEAAHLFDNEDFTSGSQFVNLITANLSEHFSIKIKNAEGMESELNRDEVVRLYDALRSENYMESFDKCLKIFEDVEVLQRRLLNAIESNPTKYDKSLKESLKLVDGHFNLELWTPSIKNQVEELCTSIWKNNVTKQTIRGGSAVMVANVGLTKKLKTIRNKKTGVTEAVECLLPCWCEDYFKPLLDSEGKLDINKFNEENGMDPELLKMVGYRIPTEDKYSMIPLKVVGFLPQENGSSIMLPADFVAASGSDFDIDKVFLRMYNYIKSYNKEKKITEIKKVSHNFLYDRENGTDVWKSIMGMNKEQRDNLMVDIEYAILTSQEGSEQMANAGHFVTLKCSARFNDILENEESFNKLIEYIFERRDTDFKDLFETKYKDYKTADSVTDKNVLYDIIYNTFERISLSDLNKLVVSSSTERCPVSPDTWTYNHQQNTAGGKMIGIYANGASFHAKLQRLNIHVTKDYSFTIGAETYDTLDELRDKKGLSIQHNISEFQGSSVDNVKDPVLKKLLQNPETAGTMLYMLRMGVPVRLANMIFKTPFYGVHSMSVSRLIGDIHNKIMTKFSAYNVTDTEKHRFDLVNFGITHTETDFVKNIVECSRGNKKKVIETMTKILNGKLKNQKESDAIQDIENLIMEDADALLENGNIENTKSNTFLAVYRNDNERDKLLSYALSIIYRDYEALFSNILNCHIVLNKCYDGYQAIRPLQNVMKADSPNNAIDINFTNAINQVNEVDKVSNLANAGKNVFPFYIPSDSDSGKKNSENFIRTQGKLYFDDFSELKSYITTIKNMIRSSDYTKTPALQSAFTFGIELPTYVMNKYFIQGNSSVRDYVSFLGNGISTLSKTKFSGFMNDYVNGLIYYLMTKTKALGKDENYSIFEKSDQILTRVPVNLAKNIKRCKEKGLDLNITSRLRLSKDGKSVIFPREGSLVKKQKDLICREFNQLFDSEDPEIRDFGRDLFLYSFYKNGFAFSPVDFGIFFDPNVWNRFPGIVGHLRRLNEYINFDSVKDYTDKFIAMNSSLFFNVKKDPLSYGCSIVNNNSSIVINRDDPKQLNFFKLYLYDPSSSYFGLKTIFTTNSKAQSADGKNKKIIWKLNLEKSCDYINGSYVLKNNIVYDRIEVIDTESLRKIYDSESSIDEIKKYYDENSSENGSLFNIDFDDEGDEIKNEGEPNNFFDVKDKEEGIGDDSKNDSPIMDYIYEKSRTTEGQSFEEQLAMTFRLLNLNEEEEQKLFDNFDDVKQKVSNDISVASAMEDDNVYVKMVNDIIKQYNLSVGELSRESIYEKLTKKKLDDIKNQDRGEC